MCLRGIARVVQIRAAIWVRAARHGRELTARLMQDDLGRLPAPTADAEPAANAHPEDRQRRRLLLVRHGETTFNVERRLPGRLSGVMLTDEGRRQAYRAAVALSALPLTAVITSPLERARDTATVIARGWSLPVQEDDRLVDTDVGRWSGQQIDELEKSDPEWKAFVAHASQAPAGVESLTAVMARAVSVVEDIRRDAQLGDAIVLVAHADVIKLIIGHYLGIHPDCAHLLHIDNASISALEFHGDAPPIILALNWTATPGWLVRALRKRETAPQQRPGGIEPMDAAGVSQNSER